MSYRKIESIFKNENHHWVGNGFRVKQYFPSTRGEDFLERFSPFILMDYNAPHTFEGTNVQTGVDIHPHRGFETVTFSFKGSIKHADNTGNTGVINEGDIQWMTAGSGILHKEFHEEEYAKNDRLFHMIQLWINLPKKDKMTAPKYQAITKDEMGIYKSEDEIVEAIVYSGEAFGVKGPASTFSPINIYKITLQKGRKIEIKEPSDFNTGLLVILGNLNVNEDTKVKTDDFVLFENDGNAFSLESLDGPSEIFVLSGQPLNESVVAYGPFVMNTYEEIVQANQDFRNGKFGPFEF